jgi:hypothetical protein
MPSTTVTTAAPTTTTAKPAPPPVPPPDPVALAAQLTESITAIRDPATPAASLLRAGQNEQVAYRAIVIHPEVLDQVLARVPAALHGTVRANVGAGLQLAALNGKPKPALPAGWRIVSPAPADELLGYYKGAEAEFGVPWQYLAAVNLVETRMGRIRGTSSAGALGPMQFLPQTWAKFGEGDINSYRDAIRAAARYLKYNGAPATMRTALWNYNRSYKYVDAVTAYAEEMRAYERAFFGYYHWQVYYRTVDGDILLPEGFSS